MKKNDIEKYGCRWIESAEFASKNLETVRKNWGVDNVSQNEFIKEKIKQTQFKHFGSWFSQTKEHQNSMYNTKEYKFPSGKIIEVQGYEPMFLDILLEIYEEQCILISSEISFDIWYEFKGERHRYFPDIFVESTNTIFEIKSTYTFEKDLCKNLCKRDAALKSGHNFHFVIVRCNKRGDRVDGTVL